MSSEQLQLAFEKNIYADLSPALLPAFEKFDRENPEIYQLVIKYTRQVRQAGLQRYGIAAIFERVRWHLQIETKGDDFKLNNNLKSFYVRKLVHEFPVFGGMFDLRKGGGAQDE